MATRVRTAGLAFAAGMAGELLGVGCVTASSWVWLSPLGVLAGVVLANTVSERVLELSFAAVQPMFA